MVIVDSIVRHPRTLQKSPAAHRRRSTPKAGSAQRPRVCECLKCVKISYLIFRGGCGGLIAVGAVEVKTKHSSSQIVIGNIRNIVFKKDCIAGLLIIPLICPDFSPQAQAAPSVTALDSNIVRAEIADVMARAWIEPYFQRRPRRILGQKVLLVLCVICSPIGFHVGIFYSSAEPTVPLAGPFLLKSSGGPSPRRP